MVVFGVGIGESADRKPGSPPALIDAACANALTNPIPRWQAPAFIVMASMLKWWGPVILWMGIIFMVSTDLGSAEHTSRIIEPLLRWLFPAISEATIGFVHMLIRKGAHFTEYAILALLVLRTAQLPANARPTARDFRAAGFALLISALYAATDEFHQSFVPARTASLRDVMIDSSGAFAALAVALLWRYLRGKTASGYRQ